MPHIRPFAPGDVEGVVAVIVPIQQVEFGLPVSRATQPDLDDIPGVYQQGRGNFWVAEIDGRIVGTIGLLDLGDRQAALRKMFVAAAWRGRSHGVAQRLLDALLDWAQAQGVDEVCLGTTDRFVAAHRFYERNGFRSIDAAALPARFPRMAVDTRFYRRLRAGPA